MRRYQDALNWQADTPCSQQTPMHMLNMRIISDYIQQNNKCKSHNEPLSPEQESEYAGAIRYESGLATAVILYSGKESNSTSNIEWFNLKKKKKMTVWDPETHSVNQFHN